jgi:hypothetical protein
MDRVSVAEAARRLGVSQDAVYKRIKRGTIPWEKGADDKTYVWIEEPNVSVDSPRSSTDRRYDSSTEQSTDPLLDELKDRIRFLEAELDDRKDEARRKDSIIMALTQRVPELEAPSEPREAPERASEEQERGATRETPFIEESETSRPERRSWWRQFFGLE